MVCLRVCSHIGHDGVILYDPARAALTPHDQEVCGVSIGILLSARGSTDDIVTGIRDLRDRSHGPLLLQILDNPAGAPLTAHHEIEWQFWSLSSQGSRIHAGHRLHELRLLKSATISLGSFLLQNPTRPLPTAHEAHLQSIFDRCLFCGP